MTSDDLTVRIFKAEDFLDLDVQSMQSYVKGEVTPQDLVSIEQEESYTILDGDEILACVGLIEMNVGRAQVWSALSQNIGKRFLAVHHIIKGLLAATNHDRLEAYVDCKHADAHKWVKFLGFVCEAECMKSFMGKGRDYAMYARYL